MANSITPPPELAQQWYRDAEHQLAPYYVFVARCAAQWGADQELAATLGLMETLNIRGVDYIRNVRRPKPPSLKEQAIRVLVENGTNLDGRMELDSADIDTLFRALGALPND
jgi:hypothetical protein